MIGFSQIENPKEITAGMSTGTAVGWKIFIPECNKKDVLKAWRKEMAQFDAKISKVKKSKDYFSDDVSISGLGEQAVDVFFQCSEENLGVYVNLFIQRENEFIGQSSKSKDVKFITEFLVRFAKAESTSAIGEELQKQQKELGTLHKEQEKLIENKSKYEQDIKEAEELIAERKRMIEQNIKDQETKSKEIEKQEKLINTTKIKLERFR